MNHIAEISHFFSSLISTIKMSISLYIFVINSIQACCLNS